MARRPVNPELLEAVKRYAPTIGLSPQDLLTIYSYETGGTLDPWQAGPRTKWGQHRGLIQWGEPQARKYGVSATTPIDQQVGASIKYLQDRGFKPGMGLLQAYAAINAGGIGPKYYQARDAGAGGAPGTVADKVNKQMAGHAQRAASLLGAPQTTLAGAPLPPPRSELAAGAPLPPARPTDPAVPTLPDNPARGILADNPLTKVASNIAADQEQQQQTAQQAAQQLQQTQAQAVEAIAPPPPPPPPTPPPPQPMAQQADYASMLLPRLRRGLLASPDYGMLGVS